jgi:hypothetical protein
MLPVRDQRFEMCHLPESEHLSFLRSQILPLISVSLLALPEPLYYLYQQLHLHRVREGVSHELVFGLRVFGLQRQLPGLLQLGHLQGLCPRHLHEQRELRELLLPLHHLQRHLLLRDMRTGLLQGEHWDLSILQQSVPHLRLRDLLPLLRAGLRVALEQHLFSLLEQLYALHILQPDFLPHLRGWLLSDKHEGL